MEALSFWVANIDELKSQLNSLPFTPNLAFVFPDVKHDIKEIQSAFNNIKIFGATSSGEILNDGVYQEGISVLLLKTPENSFDVLFEDDTSLSWEEIGSSIAKEAQNRFETPALVISAPGFSDGDDILKGIFSVLPAKARVIGGFSGDDLSFTKAKIFNNEKIANEKALIAIAFDTNQVIIDGYAANGWKIYSDVHTITNSENNVVYEIDSLPAVDVFLDIYKISKDKVFEVITELGPRYPVLLYRYDRPPVLRHPINVNLKDGSITFSANMPLFSTIEFGAEPSREIIDKTIKLFNSHLVNNYETIDAAVLFSCKARQLAFDKEISYEVKQVYDFWKKPMAGFFTYGEIGIANDMKTDFHNETCNLLIIKENH